MDAAQAHRVAVAVEERARELQHAVRFYDERGWDDLANEYRIRLREVQGLLGAVDPETHPLTEAEARAMAGDR